MLSLESKRSPASNAAAKIEPDTTINDGFHLGGWAQKALLAFKRGNDYEAVKALEKVEDLETYSRLFKQFEQAGINMMLGAKLPSSDPGVKIWDVATGRYVDEYNF